MMAPLLPSEIARLVYGQLRCNCPIVAEQFLKESPHLEECREFVKRIGKPSFMTKAYGLSLQQILERYLDMWNLILDQMNSVIPDSQEKFSDPVDALKFLLSASENGSNEVDNVSVLNDSIRPRTVLSDDASSNICLRIAPSPDAEYEIRDNLPDQNRSYDSDISEKNHTSPELSNTVKEQYPQKKPSYLDELYASAENLENPGKKKRAKVLKPRQPPLDRSIMVHSVSSDSIAAVNSEDRTSHHENESNTEVHARDNIGYEPMTPSKLQTTEVLTSTSMRLRSSNKANRRVWRECKKKSPGTSKKRKRSSSPGPENRSAKQTKTNKLTNCGKENDTPDYSRISQLLLEDSKWPELIAENINKEILESPQKRTDTLGGDKNSVIESTAEKTLDDVLTDEFIRGLLSCAQNVTQERTLEETNVSLFDDNPYDTNLNAATNEVSDSVSQMNIAGGSTDQTFENTELTRLHEDMNEFVHFNNPRTNSSTSDPHSDIIVIEMDQNEQISVQHSNNYVIESQNHSVHPNYVVCTTEEPAVVQNGNSLQDEIVNLCEDSDKVEWNVKTNPQTVVTSTSAVVNNNNGKCKLRICGPMISPTNGISTRNTYRPIAPKPNSSVVTLAENTTTVKPKSRRSKK